MSINRILGILLLGAGIAGIVLSSISDYIGLSITGGSNGWGIVNTAGIFGGSILLILGFVVSYRNIFKKQSDESMDLPLERDSSNVLLASTTPRAYYNNELESPSAVNTSQLGGPSQKNLSIMSPPKSPHQKNTDHHTGPKEEEYDYECPTCGSDVGADDSKCPVCNEELE